MNSETLSLKTVINKLDLLKKAIINQRNVRKEDLFLLATKLIDKITDPSNTKKCNKFVKQSNIITQQLNAIENLNNFDVESVTIEHPKTSHKLSKTIRQAEMVSPVGCEKVKNVWTQK